MSESILVIDDEEVMRDVLGTLLRQAGFRVTVAADGPEADPSVAERLNDAARRSGRCSS